MRIQLRSVLIFFTAITVITFFFSPIELFWFMLGFTIIISLIYLITVWAELSAWFSTKF